MYFGIILIVLGIHPDRKWLCSQICRAVYFIPATFPYCRRGIFTEASVSNKSKYFYTFRFRVKFSGKVKDTNLELFFFNGIECKTFERR